MILVISGVSHHLAPITQVSTYLHKVQLFTHKDLSTVTEPHTHGCVLYRQSVREASAGVFSHAVMHTPDNFDHVL